MDPVAIPVAEGTPMMGVLDGAVSEKAYRTLTDLIYAHSRIRLGPDKQPLLANRLRKRLQALAMDSYEEYCALLQSASGGEEIEELVDLITTNHTRFYREPEHFTFLTRCVLPALVPGLGATGGALRLWSAASSSGEEPYTMAIAVAEYLQARPSIDWQIVATDISRRMLATAAQGVYSMSAVKPVPPELLRRYFQKGVGARSGLCRVKPELRRRVHFERVNLFQANYPVPRRQHVIFCRNVMIYFDPPARAVVVQRLVQHLEVGGYLVIGHSESLMGIRHGLLCVQQGVYQKP